jgi:hypothetical protein
VASLQADFLSIYYCFRGAGGHAFGIRMYYCIISLQAITVRHPRGWKVHLDCQFVVRTSLLNSGSLIAIQWRTSSPLQNTFCK